MTILIRQSVLELTQEESPLIDIWQLNANQQYEAASMLNIDSESIEDAIQEMIGFLFFIVNEEVYCLDNFMRSPYASRWDGIQSETNVSGLAVKLNDFNDAVRLYRVW